MTSEHVIRNNGKWERAARVRGRRLRTQPNHLRDPGPTSCARLETLGVDLSHARAVIAQLGRA
jgi:hypothetical protein